MEKILSKFAVTVKKNGNYSNFRKLKHHQSTVPEGRQKLSGEWLGILDQFR